MAFFGKYHPGLLLLFLFVITPVYSQEALPTVPFPECQIPTTINGSEYWGCVSIDDSLQPACLTEMGYWAYCNASTIPPFFGWRGEKELVCSRISSVSRRLVWGCWLSIDNSWNISDPVCLSNRNKLLHCNLQRSLQEWDEDEDDVYFRINVTKKSLSLKQKIQSHGTQELVIGIVLGILSVLLPLLFLWSLKLNPVGKMKRVLHRLRYRRVKSLSNLPTDTVLYKAVYPFKGTRDDEMDLEPGDLLAVEAQFQDGWAFGVNKSKKKIVYFPKVFLKELGEKDSPV